MRAAAKARLMVHRTYVGLGTTDAAGREFEALRPHVRLLWGAQEVVGYFTADGSVLDIALDALETTVFHFTRRPRFFGPRDPALDVADLRDRTQAAGMFEALRPYAQRLRLLQGRCRPFGRDWQALNVALHGLETAAFHFTGEARFYGSRGDSSGPVRSVGGGT